MNATYSTYSEEKIIENWQYFYRHFESFDFEHLSDKQEIETQAQEINVYMNKPILALLQKGNADVYQNTLALKQALDDSQFQAVSLTETETIRANLDALQERLTNIENVEFFLQLHQQMNKNFKEAEKIRNDKAAENRGIYSIAQIDKDFDRVYKELRCFLWIKQLGFYVLVILLACVSFHILMAVLYGSSPKQDMYAGLFVRVATSFPILLSIWFLIGQIKQDRKLMHLYLHKKVLARSYMNYVEALNDRNFGSRDLETKNQIRELLLQTTIETLKDSPISTMEKSKHTNNQAIIEKLIDKFPTDK